MRKIILLAVLGASLAVSACNTVAGAGKDVSSVGHAVTHTANDAKPH
jgi:predicted small secreted protein